ncbi:MAG: SDR family NAD(P)-dependent oxidoreductase [Myxococcota bacterium]
MPNVKFPYRHALVTGASSGIGASLCQALDLAGIETITLVARRLDRLEKVAAGLSCSTRIIKTDLQDLNARVEQMETVDLLVNNAGFGSFGRFANADVEHQLDMVNLNCQAPLHLTGAVLPRMVRESHGCIVNISSGTAFQPMPYMSTYAATKSFLLHWSEGLREELLGTGVRVVAICPGTIHTEFAETSKVPLAAIPGARLVTGSMSDLVGAIMAGITKDKGVVIPGIGNFLGSFSSRFAPRILVRKLLAASLASAAKMIEE